MKKIICILLSLIMIFLLVGCNQVDTMPLIFDVESYQIKFIDENNLIYDLPENRICVPNTVFTFHAYPITDADLAMYVNGEKKCIQTNIETDDGYIWEYTFEMISEPVEIEFKIENNKGNVSDGAIESILIKPVFSSGMIYAKVGRTIQLSYIVIPSEASYNEVIWSSSDETVATVSNEGLVTFIKAGAARINLSIDGVTTSIPVKVSEIKNDEYCITLIDDYDIVLNVEELIDTNYKAGDKVIVQLRFFSGPRVGILVDGENVNCNPQAEVSPQIHEFIMPDHDVVIKTTYNDIVSSGKTDIEKHNLKDNDIFFPSEASALNKERFIASFEEMLGEKANEMEYEVLSNYVPQEKSELYNFDAFTVEMNDEIHFYAWFNGKIYNLTSIGAIINNNYHFLHFCVSDINNDGYLEISTSVNFNRTSKNPFSFTYVTIIDEYSEKIIRFDNTYNAFAYFKEDQDGVIGVYISDTKTYDDGSYDESNTLLTKLLPNDYKFTFKKREYNCSSDNYDALITIDDNTAYFPVLSDCARIGFKVNVNMTYLGESFSYVNSTGYLDGATCTFINGEDKIICEGWGETCVVTTFVVSTGMEIDRTYFYPYNLSNQFKKGTYDMVISYRGESVVIEDFLTIE